MNRILILLASLILAGPACGETISYHGGKYFGAVSGGVPHGHGTWTHPTGEEYVGDWKNGVADGQGILSTPSGEKIVGEFKEDRPWNGIYYGTDGSVIGQISDGVLTEKR